MFPIKCKQVVLITPESGAAWYNLARVEFFAARALKDIQMLQQAKESAEKAFKFEPSEQVKELLAKIQQTIEELADIQK